VLISNSGQVSLNEVTAGSGSAADIQTAVNIVASRGGGKVYVPAGIWNFTPAGVWTTVNVPAGVNIFGAPNQRYANGSNVGWNTVLVQTWNVPSGDLAPNAVYKDWFDVTGTTATRISDLELRGYASVNTSFNSTIYYLVGISLTNVMDFRVDHMNFNNIRSGGVHVLTSTANAPTRGVIDHCSFINTGDPYPGYGTNVFLPGQNNYAHRTVDYAIMPYGNSLNNALMWNSNIYDVLGHYTNYTTVIENNIFSEWRHDVSSINGMSYVFRYNIVYGEDSAGCIDGHGTYTYVPTRSMEIYNNTFLDPNRIYEIQPNVVNARGGGGVFFNNSQRDYLIDIITVAEDKGAPFPQGIPGSSDCPWYAWNNINLALTPDNYARNGLHQQTPTLEIGLGIVKPSIMPNYTPYPYPHPLTLKP
jgi:hypothetical protein